MNPFACNALFLSFKTCFQGVEKGCIGIKWVKSLQFYLLQIQADFLQIQFALKFTVTGEKCRMDKEN